ncbi:MAG: hypothetical protein ACKPKO_02760, partial [Candidatus Fonsibacter sp.]
IAGVPLDMDAEREFDEVEFGDGDMSHHMYSHMSGINITWYPREEDVMQDFSNELCDMFGLKYNDFWVTYHGRPCRPETIAYSLPHGAWMSINFCCHSGGKRGRGTKKKDDEEEKSKDDVIDEILQGINELSTKTVNLTGDSVLQNIGQHISNMVAQTSLDPRSAHTSLQSMPRENLVKVYSALNTHNSELKLNTLKQTYFQG